MMNTDREIGYRYRFIQEIDDLGRPGAVELARGTWKTRHDNPLRPDGLLHEYCPPIHVAAEMDRLIDMYAGYKRQSMVHMRFLPKRAPPNMSIGSIGRSLPLQKDWSTLPTREPIIDG